MTRLQNTDLYYYDQSMGFLVFILMITNELVVIHYVFFLAIGGWINFVFYTIIDLQPDGGQLALIKPN